MTPSFAFSEDECSAWFKKSGVKSGHEGCEISCGLIPIDMSSFNCGLRCKEFCKAKDCISDEHWKDKLKSSFPTGWDIKSEVSKPWIDTERNQIISILNQLPSSLKNLPINGIYRMKKSVDIINPAATSKDGSTIVIYDRAFHNPFWTIKEVILHEIGHVVFINLDAVDRSSYSASAGWKKSISGIERRLGDFVSSRAKDDINEDFAENFSFFLHSQNILKEKVPRTYEWFMKKYKNNFKMNEECSNEKK